MNKMLALSLTDYVSALQKAGLFSAFIGNEKEKELLIKQLTFDSRKVCSDCLFVCKGKRFLPSFLDDAVAAGATAYVAERAYDQVSIPGIIVTDVRRAMPVLAGLFFAKPWEDLQLIGITGTKGKTTTAFYLKAILDDYSLSLGRRESAIISTVGIYDGKGISKSIFTTPENIETVGHIRNAVDSGIDFMTMEASSLGIKYGRVDGIRYNIGIFTNISEDHIDSGEHPNFEDYIEAKLRLFDMSDIACVNLDADMVDRVLAAASASQKVITFGTCADADVRGYGIRKEDGLICFRAVCSDFDEEFALSMPGFFNVENALAAITAARALNIPLKYIRSGLLRAKVPGRMEIFTSRSGMLTAIVDYAHNKLSYEKLFASIQKEYPNCDIVSVFGCSGGKTRLRRKYLGTIAGQYSKKVYLVPDDPDYESADDISKEIAAYLDLQNCPYEIIENRGMAIQKAIMGTKSPTVLLILGKGNEAWIKDHGKDIPYPTDAEYVRETLKNLLF